MDIKDVVVGESYYIGNGDVRGEVLFIEEKGGVALVRGDDTCTELVMIVDMEVEREKIFSVRATLTYTTSRWIYGAIDKEDAEARFKDEIMGIYGEDATVEIIDVKEVDDSSYDEKDD